MFKKACLLIVRGASSISEGIGFGVLFIQFKHTRWANIYHPCALSARKVKPMRACMYFSSLYGAGALMGLLITYGEVTDCQRETAQ